MMFGALLTAGLVLTQFTLKEQPAAVLRLFHERPHVAVSQAGQVMQFHGTSHAPGCDDGRQWVFFFDKSDRLVSVTRNLDVPVRLSAMLPKGAKARRFETGERYPLLRVSLPDGREVIALGATSVTDSVSQVQLVRSPDVARLYPSLRAVE